MERNAIVFAAKKKVELQSQQIPECDFSPDAIGGRTLYTLVSAGTEINACYLDVLNWGLPRGGGYAAVFEVEYVGSNVTGFQVGDIVFTAGMHLSYTICHHRCAVKVPGNVLPQEALFVRIAGISMATLSRTQVHPGNRVMVTGLGAVGLMAMQAYQNSGYTVIGVDPAPGRCEAARQLGLAHVFTDCPFDDPQYDKNIGLALECSGNEQAVLNCCAMVRKEGEISLIGVPWKPSTTKTVFELLNPLFYQYAHLYSGWELNLPEVPGEFSHDSQYGNFALAMDWMAAGRLKADGLYEIRPAAQAQQVYDDIYLKKFNKLTAIFDWQ